MKNIMLVILMLSFLPTLVYGEADTIICNYSSYSNENGNHKVTDRFVLTFIVDMTKKTAYMLGSQGTEEVTLIPSGVGEGVSFVEITGVGNVMTTAIDSKGNSVHSRNTIIHGEIVPTQYYGKCEFK
jgi:hypothetical protein